METIPGIRLNKDAKIDRVLNGMDIAVTPEQGLKFLQDTEDTTVESVDGYLSVGRNRYGDYRLIAEAARARGGLYYLNHGVLQIIGKDFQKRGKYMEALNLTEGQALAVMQELARQGTGFLAKGDKEAARKITAGEALASIRPGEFLAARNESAKGLTVARLKGIVGRLNGLAQNASEVEAIQSFWELPGHLQRRFAGHVSSLEGVYDPATGKVWLVADNLESARRATEVWCHEQIVHNGLRGLFSEGERKRVLNQIWLALGGMGNKTVRQVAEAYGINPRSDEAARLLVMEETLANMAERNQAGLLGKREENLWQKIARIVANAINKIVEKLTGQKSRIGMEEVDRLLSALGQYVMGGKQQGQNSRGEAAASLGKKGEVNSYGIPMDRVTEIEGEITFKDLKDALEEIAGIDLPNVLEGLTAQVNRNQREKMASRRASEKSHSNGFSYGEHSAAAAKIANIWKWAAQVRREPDSKNNKPDLAIRRFVSAIKINGKDSFAWLTVKETNEGLRIYSVELLNERKLWDYMGNGADSTATLPPAQSFEKKQLRLYADPGNSESSGSPVRSYGETLARLAGPVKSESDEVNSYGVPMERVTEIEGNITSEELNAALRELAGQDLENVLEGLTAQVNGNQRRKLESQKARQQSVDNGFSNAEHRVAVSKIANIWKWAAEAKGVGGRKEDNPETTIRRFVSALSVNGRDSFAWLTIKDTQNGSRLYSAELLTKKELQEKFDGVVADKALTGAASWSVDEILSRLAGPVKSESTSDTPLASLNLRDLLNLSGKKTAELANAPEISGSFDPDDLKWYQHFFALPHWISKTQGNFARIYERQIRRRDERSAKVMQSLAEVPALFGKGSLGKADMESLNNLVWEIEGNPLPFEEVDKVRKYLEDGQFDNGRPKIKPNPAFYKEYEKAIDRMDATPAARKAMLEIRKSLDRDLANAYNRLAEMSEASDDAITKLRNNIGNVRNYFPRHRYGKYYIQAIDPEGNVVYREHFDALTSREAAKKAREIAAREQAEYPDAKWKQGINSKLPDEVLGAPIEPEAMEQIIKAAAAKIGDREQAKEITDLLCAATADVLKTRGWTEHAIGRKGIPGHETQDLARVLYDYKNGLYGWLTKMDAARDFSRALGEINAKKQPKLWGYASRYIKDMLRNYDSIDRMTGNIKAVAFAWYLGGNIKTAAVNATQNLIVGVPRLQMDVRGGGRIWLKAAMDSIVNRVTGNTGKNLTDDEARLVKELYEESVITDAFMTEVRGHLEGASFASGWNKFTKILGLPMSEAERFNRASLALAAYRAAMAGKLKKAAMEKYGINGKATYEQAKAYATEVVNDAHFVYGKSNLPELLRGNATGRGMGSLYTFRTFSHNMVNMWLWALKNQGREGAMFTAKSLGATIALGGLTAFPFYATLAALCQMASGDDEDWTEKIRKYMPENNVMRDVVCYGAPAIGGINLGGSLQMETPFTRGMQKAEDADSFMAMMGEGILGIPYDLAKKGVKATESVGMGEYFQALKEAAPTFVKNGLDAWELYFEGQHTKNGKPITRPGETEPVKLTGYEAIAKGLLGFQPLSSAKRYAARAAQQRAEKSRSDAIERVAQKFLEARKTGDPKFQREGIAEMKRWNEEKKAEGKEYLMFNQKDVTRRVNQRKARKPNAKTRAQGEREMELWGV